MKLDQIASSAPSQAEGIAVTVKSIALGMRGQPVPPREASSSFNTLANDPEGDELVLGRTCLGQDPAQLAGRCHSHLLGQGRDRNDQREKKHSNYIKIQLEENFQVLKSERSQAEADIF